MDLIIAKIGDYWWVIIWLLFCGSFISSFFGEAFSSTEKKRLARELEASRAMCAALSERHSKLMILFGSKCGESSQFSSGEIRNLIKLCHPDKHGGSVLAKDITAKLLGLR